MSAEHKCLKEGELATLKAEVKTLFKKAENTDRLTESIHTLEKNIRSFWGVE